MMRKIFADTSGWLAIIIKSDFLHEKAVKTYSELLNSDCNFVTHEAVLLEVGNSLSNTKAREVAVKLKENIENSNRIELVSLSIESCRSGLETLRRAF